MMTSCLRVSLAVTSSLDWGSHSGCKACTDARATLAWSSLESGCLRVQPKVGGKLHPKAKYDHETDSKQVP